MHSSLLQVETEYISAGCNCTYNSFELLSDDVLVYGANHALVFYNFEERKAVRTAVAHDGRVNCVRSIKFSSKNNEDFVTCGSDGKVVVWKQETLGDYCSYVPLLIKAHKTSIAVCDGIECSPNEGLVGCISASKIILYQFKRSEKILQLVQEVELKLSVALDLAFHKLDDTSSNVILACGMDNGSVILYGQDESGCASDVLINFSEKVVLKKHEDWVRCVSFATYQGQTFMAVGGEDSFISIWRFTASEVEFSEFEFQVHKFGNYNVLFESIIMGHEGWINSLHWIKTARDNQDIGGLISCSSDQSIIIWDKGENMWVEKSRFGTIGGQIPGGFGAKSNGRFMTVCGFQGAIQIWQVKPDEEECWILEPSITGHFGPISDLDYDIGGHYVVTTSEDQTTRVHSPWGEQRWHEISRPQIHGHDLFTVKVSGDYIISGAEEKILRAFQPTDIFVKNLENASEMPVDFLERIAPAATLPALGLSNLPEDGPIGAENSDTQHFSNLNLDSRLDEDFLRSQTLWPEVSKLYGHVYEICCIATSPVDPLIASGSQSSKPQFSSIILWSSETWKNLGEYPFHKLNVTDMEFSSTGDRLLSASRDRTWALWSVIRDGTYSLQILESGSCHTRALWVCTWGPNDSYFVTGARDKKLAVWTVGTSTNEPKHEASLTQDFPASVSAASVNADNLIAVGLETGLIYFYRYDTSKLTSGLALLLKLDNNTAHHGIIRRLKYNPYNKMELASAGADHFLKVYRLTYQGS